MYHVIHCTDPWLLARMMTDLQMEGYILYHNAGHPWKPNWNWLLVDSSTMLLLCHSGLLNPTRHTLTEDNYLEVLGKVMGSK